MVSDLVMGPGANGDELLRGSSTFASVGAAADLGAVTDGQAACVVESGVAHDFIGKPRQSGEVLTAIRRQGGPARFGSGPNLARKGYLRRHPGKARGLVVPSVKNEGRRTRTRKQR